MPSSPVALLLRRVVRGDRERAEADRRATRRARSTPRMTGRRSQRWRASGDEIGAVHLGDLAVRLAHRDRPGGRPAHHHALEHRLTADAARSRREARGSGAASSEPSRAGAGSARRGRPCRRASASRCRTGGTPSRSRRGAPDFVERVVKVFPHEQRTVARTYSGWISVFIQTLRISEAISGRYVASGDDDRDGCGARDVDLRRPAARRHPRRRRARPPASRARRGSGTRPRISSSVTVTVSTPRASQISSASAPAKGR